VYDRLRFALGRVGLVGISDHFLFILKIIEVFGVLSEVVDDVEIGRLVREVLENRLVELGLIIVSEDGEKDVLQGFLSLVALKTWSHVGKDWVVT
jgi:hypothetical protein